MQQCVTLLTVVLQDTLLLSVLPTGSGVLQHEQLGQLAAVCAFACPDAR